MTKQESTCVPPHWAQRAIDKTIQNLHIAIYGSEAHTAAYGPSIPYYLKNLTTALVEHPTANTEAKAKRIERRPFDQLVADAIGHMEDNALCQVTLWPELAEFLLVSLKREGADRLQLIKASVSTLAMHGRAG